LRPIDLEPIHTINVAAAFVNCQSAASEIGTRSIRNDINEAVFVTAVISIPISNNWMIKDEDEDGCRE
jgi:hypothetical protein